MSLSCSRPPCEAFTPPKGGVPPSLRIPVIMNVLLSVVQSLCSCVQIETRFLVQRLKFRESCFKRVYVKLKQNKEGCCVSVLYICLWRLC